MQHHREWYGKNTTRLIPHKYYNLIYYQCDGTGTCIDYPLFPGINLIFMDFNCTDIFKETLPKRDLLDIRHYQHGRVEFEFQNQKVFHMREDEFCINTLSNMVSAPASYSFPFGCCNGVSFIIDRENMEQRLKEMESKALAETAEPQTAEQAGSGPGITAGQQMAEPAGNNTGDSARDDYLAAIRGRNGEKHLVPVERSVRRKPDGLKVFAEKLFGRGRQSSGLIKQLTGKGLNPAQMEQVRMAVQAGLTGQEVNDLIDSGFSADEMAQAVEIVVAERAYQ